MAGFVITIYSEDISTGNTNYASAGSITIPYLKGVSVDVKNSSNYQTVVGEKPYWINMGPEYKKIKISGSYGRLGQPTKIESGWIISGDLPEFQDGLWKVGNFAFTRTAKTSGVWDFTLEATYIWQDESESKYVV